MSVFLTKTYSTSLQSLYQLGGRFVHAFNRANVIQSNITNNGIDAIERIPTTNNGETRIKNCIKFDLTNGCRLITVRKQNNIILLFAGNHEACDKYLDKNRGLTWSYNNGDKELVPVYVSTEGNRIDGGTDYSLGKLYTKIPERYKNKIFEGLPTLLINCLEDLDSLFQDDDILRICEMIGSDEQTSVIMDVFLQLRSGKIDEAKARIDLYINELQDIDEVSSEVIENSRSNDQIINLADFDAKDLELFLNGRDWYEWMLFMHPQQREVMELDFSGPARLLGVSGSGKTCVAVRRAVRLAKQYEGEKVLIVTINRALSKLIKDLVDVQFSDEENGRDSIEVKSFWELCKDLLLEFEPDRERWLNDFADRHGESVVTIWEEFYNRENNNDDASVLMDIHQSLLSRSVNPQAYLNQEFDWIRSAIWLEEREEYLNLRREGRKEQMGPEYRESILQGLTAWEDKMFAIGVSDDLNLLKYLKEHFDKITPRYRSIIVDELQDFGTSELTLIRKLAKEQENDLFLCGDIVQKVHAKHQQITKAGIRIAPNNYKKIVKNYRNSREILEAADAVLRNNIQKEDFASEGYEVLVPEYANFSSPKPFLREADNLAEEFIYSLNYLKEMLSEKQKGCIAICGYDYYDVLKISNEFNLPSLSNEIVLESNNIFISDLEQTKGFEFDYMIIINCSHGSFPTIGIPEGERFREISKLYVAMTRAKRELVISYADKPSSLFEFEGSADLFTKISWDKYLEIDPEEYEFPEPSSSYSSKDFLLMTGLKFVYNEKAIGLSVDLQKKIIDLVDGYSTKERGNEVSWRTFGDLKNYCSSSINNAHLSNLFGPTVFKELQDFIRTIDSKENSSVLDLFT